MTIKYFSQIQSHNAIWNGHTLTSQTKVIQNLSRWEFGKTDDQPKFYQIFIVKIFTNNSAYSNVNFIHFKHVPVKRESSCGRRTHGLCKFSISHSQSTKVSICQRINPCRLVLLVALNHWIYKKHIPCHFTLSLHYCNAGFVC